MRFSFLRRGHLAAIFTGIVVAVGCSSSSPAAQAYVYGTLTPTTGGSCAGIQSSMTEFLQVGTQGTTPSDLNSPTRVPDGGPNHVSCSVKGSGSTYQISLAATSDSTITGGSLILNGNDVSPMSGVTMDIQGTFVGVATSGQYEAMDCVLTYPEQSNNETIAPGRIWGHVDCAGATNHNVSVGTAVSTCNVAVDFVFENCGS
jgi:hypothetical protein